jgi:hypothetical protein
MRNGRDAPTRVLPNAMKRAQFPLGDEVGQGGPHVSRKWLTSVLVAAVVISGAAACAADDNSVRDSAAGRSPKLAPSEDAGEETAKQRALAAYAGYLEAARIAEAIPDPNHPGLEKYLADPLLTTVRVAINDVKEHGAMRTGKLISDPRVTAVSLDTVPATVTIQDCIDASGYRMVYADNRAKTYPGHAAGRYVATATAALYGDGRWLINSGVAHRDQPC